VEYRRRVKPLPALLVVATAVAAGGVASALAQGGAAPEPKVTARQVLHLPGVGRCTIATLVTVRVTVPAGATLRSLRVRAGGRELVRLHGVPDTALVRLRLPPAGGRVSAFAETLGGQTVSASRMYRHCHPRRIPAAPPPPETVTGGGTS
jgi:hypothetical protein